MCGCLALFCFEAWRRFDGVYLYFEDNAGVIVNEKGKIGVWKLDWYTGYCWGNLIWWNIFVVGVSLVKPGSHPGYTFIYVMIFLNSPLVFSIAMWQTHSFGNAHESLITCTK